MNYMPHGTCILWNPQMLALHIGSDALIALAYLTISATLFIMRPHLPLSLNLPRWAFGSFGTFILSCGLTHVMNIVTMYYPLYWFEGFVKFITGMSSCATAFVLVVTMREFLKQVKKVGSDVE